MPTRQSLAEPLNITVVFEFEGDQIIVPTLIEDAFAESLSTRGIDLDTLGDTEKAGFDQASDLIDSVVDAEIETSADVSAVVGDTLDVTFVEDLSTTDGTALDGAAVLDSDKIILDSALAGAALRDALVEEIAETAYQQAFDTTSVGDFGAETVLRLKGEDDAQAVAALSEEVDVVETEFGTAEALTSANFEELSAAIVGGNSSVEVLTTGSLDEEDYFNDRDLVLAAAEANGEMTAGQNIFGDSPVEIMDGLGYVTPFDWDDDGNDTTTIRYFVDNYGVTDRFWPTDDTDTASATVLDWADVGTLEPIAGASGTLLGSGTNATSDRTVSISEGETYSTTEEFNWSASVSASGSVFGLGLDVSTTVGGSVSETNSFTATDTVSDRYIVSQADYEEGDVISYGQHALLRDATIADVYRVYYQFTDDDGVEGYGALVLEDTQVVEDYMFDVVMTDYLLEQISIENSVSTFGLA